MTQLPDHRHADKIDSVLPPRYEGPVWHYTSAQGVLGILQSQSLWASSITQLNDTQEIDYGLNLIDLSWERWTTRQLAHRETISSWLRDAKSKVDSNDRLDSYLVCGSTESSSHTQFLTYGSYAIGINGAFLLEKTSTTSPQLARYPSRAFDFGWRPVRYTSVDKRAHIDDLFKSLVALAQIAEAAPSGHEAGAYEAAMECILRSAVYMKDESFAHEHEVRLYGRAMATSSEVSFRIGKYGIVPFITIQLSKTELELTNRFPVMEINVGPGLPERESAITGLKLALRHLGYRQVQVNDRTGSRRL